MATAAKQGSKWSYMLAYYVMNTIGVLCAACAVGFGSTAEFEIGAWPRTLAGLLAAVIMGGWGEWLARHTKEDGKWANAWFSTNLVSFAYLLAYFFVYAMYYVPVLKGVDTPYAAWGAGLLLAGVAAVHGFYNKHVRWFTSPFTVLATAHALALALTSTSVVNLAGHDLNVATIGCFVGMLWCGLLSVGYKRAELKYPKWANCKTADERIGSGIYFLSHEAFFIGAIGCAMWLPLSFTSLTEAKTIWAWLQDAPTWWAWEAPLLLLISWRHGNFTKHAYVGLMWAAAALVFVNAPFGAGLPVLTIASVVGVGAVLAMAYRFESKLPKSWQLPAGVPHEHKVIGYMVYLYAAIACALLVPVKHLGLWDAMPFILVAALGICALGLALRDGIVHMIGVGASTVGLLLFFGHYETWTWNLVGPVVAFCYGLSLSYTYVAKQGGWKRSDFLPDSLGGEYAISERSAEILERVWSWVGFLTLAGASYVLVDHAQSVFWWAAEGVLIMGIAWWTDRPTYRLQGWIVLSLGLAKLAVLDLAASNISWDWAKHTLEWNPGPGAVWHLTQEFSALSLSWLFGSWVYKRKVDWMKAAEAAANAAIQTPAPGNGDDTQS